MNKNTSSKLPQIPNKRYFTIGEVGNLCSVKPHVLRYWEQEFPQLRPAKRRGNRRYYQREDVIMVRNIRGLLYDEGYTISGARIQLDVVVKQQKQDSKAELKSKAVNNAYTFNFKVAAEDTHSNLHPEVLSTTVEKTPITSTSCEPTFIIDPPEVKPAVELRSSTAASSPSLRADQAVNNQFSDKIKNYRLTIDQTIVELKEILQEIEAAKA